MMPAAQPEQSDAKYWRFDLDTRPALLGFCRDRDIGEFEWLHGLSEGDRKIAAKGDFVYLPFITLGAANEIIVRLNEIIK